MDSGLFSIHYPELTAPYAGAAAITPNNSAILTQPTKAIYVGGAGNVALQTIAGDRVVLMAVPVGTVIPVRAQRVYATAVNATAASGTLTFGSAGVAADTITVGDDVLTLVAATPGAGEVLIGADASETATNVAAAIDALATVSAAAVGAVVTVTTVATGNAANNFALAASGDVTVVAMSGGDDGNGATSASNLVALY